MASSFYFPDRLLKKLERISETAVTAVVAPAGYGKTNIVAQKTAESALKTFWFDSAELRAQRHFAHVCREFEQISPAFAAELEECGLPNSDNALQIMNLIHKHEMLIDECIVVFDNFQALQTLLPKKLIAGLLHHQGRKLHLVFLTSHMWEGLFFDPGPALLIDIEDFAITPTEIIRYFRLENREISSEEAERIFIATGGWNLAVYSLMHQCSYSTAEITESEIQSCLNRLILNRYSRELSHVMLCLSPFASFSDKTVNFVLADEKAPADILSILKSTPLINYNLISQEYHLHPTVSRCFCSLLDKASPVQKKRVYERAGRYHGLAGNIIDQLHCYSESEDDELILQMDHVAISSCLEGDEAYAVLIESILKRTSPNILLKYPLTLLCFARQLFAVGKTDTACLIVDNLSQYAEEKEDSQLLGETFMLAALGELPHISSMHEKYEIAAGLLNQGSAIFQPAGTFLFGHPSMIAIFYLMPGSADKIVEEFEESLRIFTKLSHGQGAGANLLFRGEMALMRCLYDEALILAYKAETAAGAYGQQSILAGAALLKGFVALARNDQVMVNESLNYLNGMLKSAERLRLPARFCERVSFSLAVLLHSAGRPDSVKVKDICTKINLPGDSLHLLAFLVSLYETKQYARLISIVEGNSGLLKQSGVIQWIDSQLLLALSYAALGKKDLTACLVEEALKVAEKDQILYPFSARADELSKFLPEHLLLRISQGADRKLWQSMSQQKLVNTLTDREREVAVLAAKGLRNREIAEKLYLSDGTVRNHLSIVYQKLDIDRRSQLSDYEHILLDHDKMHDI